MIQGIGPDMSACEGLSLNKSEKLRGLSRGRSGPICSCTTYYGAKLTFCRRVTDAGTSPMLAKERWITSHTSPMRCLRQYCNCGRVSESRVRHHHYSGVRVFIPWPEDGEVRLESGTVRNSLGTSKRMLGTITCYGFHCHRDSKREILGACTNKTVDRCSDISLI